MKTFGSRQPLTLAQARFKRQYSALLRPALDRMNAVLVAQSGVDGKIRNVQAVKTQVEQIVSDVFTGRDNHHAFDDKGNPLAPYPKLLASWMAFGVYSAVKQQQEWMKRNLPDELFTTLARGKTRQLVSQMVGPTIQWVNPYNRVDDRGYKLSDRIWRTDLQTRQKIDELLSKGIAQGKSAVDLSKALEAYLIPGREGSRTLRPYGLRFPAGGASYDAMRLGRTEIASAFNSAAVAAGQANPFVTHFDVARSGGGDPTCDICDDHATLGIGGERLREPYPQDEVDDPPFHPHCQCIVLQLVSENPQDVADELQQMIEDGDVPETPADLWGFLQDLLTPEILALLWELLGLNEAVQV